MCHIRIHQAIYQWSNYMRTKYIDTTNVSFHGVRRVGKSGPLLHTKGLIQGFQTGFHCVILDLKDLLSHLFCGIVTFNN